MSDYYSDDKNGRQVRGSLDIGNTASADDDYEHLKRNSYSYHPSQPPFIHNQYHSTPYPRSSSYTQELYPDDLNHYSNLRSASIAVPPSYHYAHQRPVLPTSTSYTDLTSVMNGTNDNSEEREDGAKGTEPSPFKFSNFSFNKNVERKKKTVVPPTDEPTSTPDLKLRLKSLHLQIVMKSLETLQGKVEDKEEEEEKTKKRKRGRGGGQGRGRGRGKKRSGEKDYETSWSLKTMKKNSKSSNT
eukprot:TRINITY_DN4592_c0_g1_i1.p1 TRINITY_DN4592_c0_g1~~TRINITY_DN4592_c0_g1_i1.p1  ORF type:complete len:243 (-),score=62.52 TRINITY_DN4592_c0_g1_i1:36-764(-)